MGVGVDLFNRDRGHELNVSRSMTCSKGDTLLSLCFAAILWINVLSGCKVCAHEGFFWLYEFYLKIIPTGI